MYFKLTIKNYRCFPDSHPAVLEVRPGLTALIGVNNAGKSALLRFPYEFRQMFTALVENSNILFNAIRGSAWIGIQFPSPILDNEEVFSNVSDRPIILRFDLVPEAGDPPP